MTFTTLAERYNQRYRRALFSSRGLRWLPAGAALGILAFLFSLKTGFSPWLSLPFVFVPSVVAGVLALTRTSGIPSALSWLDRESGGRQQLQAAWHCRSGDFRLKDEVSAAGCRYLEGLGPNPPVPTVGPVTTLTALLSVTLWLLLAVVGARLLLPSDEELRYRGEELEFWAEAWAEELDDDREGRELADRMSRLGRRMASGELGAGQSEQALRELEEKIEERQEDLVRDKVAESLADDLGMDRDSADVFRVGKKRLPADILSELGEAIAGSTLLRQADRDQLERLLSDPSLRDETGRGRPELTDELTEALDRALETDDPRREDLARAQEQSRRARSTDPTGEDDIARQDSPASPERAQPAIPGESGQAGEGGDDGGEPSESTGRSGGSGRGESPVLDDSGGTLPPAAANSDSNPMRLPSGPGSESWKTVIRAYGEAGDQLPSGDADSLPDWESAVESAIGREDIPPALRDYVMEYFLALENGAGIGGTPMDQPSGADSSVNQHAGTTREE